MPETGLAEQKAILEKQIRSVSRLIVSADDAMPSQDVRKRTKHWIKSRWKQECQLASLNKQPNPEYPPELKRLDPENTRIDVIEASVASLKQTVVDLTEKLDRFFNEPVTPVLKPEPKKTGQKPKKT